MDYAKTTAFLWEGFLTMHLVRFLLFGSILSIIFGEFSHYPFGAAGGSVQLIDVLTSLTVVTFGIWIVITHYKLIIPQAFKIMIFFWMVALVSLAVASFSIPAVETFKGSLYLVRLMMYSVIFLIVYQLKERKEFSQELLSVYFVTGVVFALVGLTQFVFFPNFDQLTLYGYDPHQSRLTSTFLDPNFAGTFLIFVIAILVSQRNQFQNRVLSFSILFLLVSSLILTFSRSAYLTITIFIILLAVTKWKKFLLLIPVILLLILFVPRVQERVMGGFNLDKSASARVESWQNGWTIFQQSTFIGAGFNTLRYTQQQLNLIKPYSADGGHAGSGVDSSLLLVLSTTGIVGLIIYSWFWLKVIIKLFRKKNDFTLITSCFLIALLINSHFINSLFYAPLMLCYFSAIGLVYEE